VVNNGQGGDSSHTASHSVDEVNIQNNAAGVMDNASILSNTNGDNARCEIMLQQYSESLAQSGTIRNVVEEKILSQASWVLFSKESSSSTQIQTCQTRGILQRYYIRKCKSLRLIEMYGGSRLRNMYAKN